MKLRLNQKRFNSDPLSIKLSIKPGSKALPHWWQPAFTPILWRPRCPGSALSTSCRASSTISSCHWRDAIWSNGPFGPFRWPSAGTATFSSPSWPICTAREARHLWTWKPVCSAIFSGKRDPCWRTERWECCTSTGLNSLNCRCNTCCHIAPKHLARQCTTVTSRLYSCYATYFNRLRPHLHKEYLRKRKEVSWVWPKDLSLVSKKSPLQFFQE